jgi:hypothetical protein
MKIQEKFRQLLRRATWIIIRKMDEPDIPHVVFMHMKCGSQQVIPLGKFFHGWKEPAFECLGCGVLTNQNISSRLVDPKDEAVFVINTAPAYPLY